MTLGALLALLALVAAGVGGFLGSLVILAVGLGLLAVAVLVAGRQA